MGVQCWALVLEVKNRVGKSLSSSYHLSVAFLGVPYFTVEPEDVSVSPNAPFHMACAAVGPPEPVTIVWWMGDSRVGLPDISPSILNVSGKAAASAEGHWASKVWKGRGEESSLPYMPKWHWVATQFGNVLWLHVSEGWEIMNTTYEARSSWRMMAVFSAGAQAPQSSGGAGTVMKMLLETWCIGCLFCCSTYMVCVYGFIKWLCWWCLA